MAGPLTSVVRMKDLDKQAQEENINFFELVESFLTFFLPGKRNILFCEILEWLCHVSDTFDKFAIIVTKT